MLKWARDRVMALRSANQAETIVSARADEPKLLSIATVAQSVTTRVVAISSAGIDVFAGRKLLVTPLRAPLHAPVRKSFVLRRPGVLARWKGQNRVPFQNIV